ncbi:MAG: hypothetical protein M3011_05730, partial [Actinomycetota bacterium]|nr:hypothetical protein [Actinomycetota bacterium]
MSDNTVPGFGAVRRNHSSIARRRSRVLVGCLLLAASMGFVSCLATVARSSPKPPPTPPRYAAFAQGVAEDYLAGRPTAVPTRPEMNSAVGRVVASDPTASNTPRNSRPVALSYDYLVWESATRTTLGNLPIEIHRFLVGANRQLFTLSVTIAETPTGPVVHALPSPGPALLADAS